MSANLFRSAVYILAVPLFLAGGGCGGGSSGTGVKSFTGRVQFSDGTPIPAVQVTIPETGANTMTDESGHYDVDTEIGGGSKDVSFVAQDVESIVAVDSLPEGNADVNLDVTLSAQTLVVEDTQVNVTSRDDNDDSDHNHSGGGDNSGGGGSSSSSSSSAATATPTANPTGTPDPNETPPPKDPEDEVPSTPTPNPTATATATSTPKPTSTSTPAPTSTPQPSSTPKEDE